MSVKGKAELEVVYQIWDEHGDRIEVGPDRDGLDLTEIRSYSGEGKLGQAITMTGEMLDLLITALQKHREATRKE